MTRGIECRQQLRTKTKNYRSSQETTVPWLCDTVSSLKQLGTQQTISNETDHQGIFEPGTPKHRSQGPYLSK